MWWKTPPVRHIKIMNNNGIVNGLSAPKAKMENFRPNRTPNSRSSSSIEWNRTECLWLLDFIMRYSSKAKGGAGDSTIHSKNTLPPTPHPMLSFTPGWLIGWHHLGTWGAGWGSKGYNNLETPTRKKSASSDGAICCPRFWQQHQHFVCFAVQLCFGAAAVFNDFNARQPTLSG